MPRQVRWGRVTVEGLVIVVSILLAFAIDAAWDQSRARAREAEIVAALLNELESNKTAILGSIEGTEDRLALIERFMAASEDELAVTHPDSVYRLVMGLPNAPTFRPQVAAAELLAETPVATSAGVRLKAWADSWLRLISVTAKEGELLRERHDRVQEHLVRFVSDDALRESTVLPEAVAASGARVLAQLRADRQLLEAVLLKRHTQGIYLTYLSDLQGLLEASGTTE